MDSAAKPSDPIRGADADETLVKVTPAMVEAGVAALARHCPPSISGCAGTERMGLGCDVAADVGMIMATMDKRAYLRSVRAAELDPGAPGLFNDFVAFLEAAPHLEQHYYRYCRTFRSMLAHLPDLAGTTILETGGVSVIAAFLERCGATIRGTSSDLRYSIDAADAAADIVLSLEVIEHLKDQNPKGPLETALWVETGAVAYVADINRVLKPGGLVFLTTPNPASAIALSELAAGRAAMVSRGHPREYAREELHELFSSFDLVAEESHYSFFLLTSEQQARQAEVFRRNGWDESFRGDDHFMVFRKR